MKSAIGIEGKRNQQSRMQILLRTLASCSEIGREDHEAKFNEGLSRMRETGGSSAKHPTANLLEQVVASSGKGEIRTNNIASITAAKITDFIQPATS